MRGLWNGIAVGAFCVVIALPVGASTLDAYLQQGNYCENAGGIQWSVSGQDAQTSSSPGVQLNTNVAHMDDLITPVTLSGQTSFSGNRLRTKISGQYRSDYLNGVGPGDSFLADSHLESSISTQVSISRLSQRLKFGGMFQTFYRHQGTSASVNGPAQMGTQIKVALAASGNGHAESGTTQFTRSYSGTTSSNTDSTNAFVPRIDLYDPQLPSEPGYKPGWRTYTNRSANGVEPEPWQLSLVNVPAGIYTLIISRDDWVDCGKDPGHLLRDTDPGVLWETESINSLTLGYGDFTTFVESSDGAVVTSSDWGLLTPEPSAFSLLAMCATCLVASRRR